jgi:hypothetical protein
MLYTVSTSERAAYDAANALTFVDPLPDDAEVHAEHQTWDIAQAEAHLEQERLATWDRVLP